MQCFSIACRDAVAAGFFSMAEEICFDEEGAMPDNHDMLTPQRCCLMIVDPQERLMVAIHKADRVVRNTVLLFHCARILEIPVLATTQYRKGLGPFVPELEELLAGGAVVDKTEFNGFANEAVREALKKLPGTVDTILLAGAEAHICIFQTAMGARAAGAGLF